MNMGKINKDTIMNSKAAGMLETFFNENGPTAAMIGAGLCLIGVIYTAFKASKDIVKSEDEYAKDVQDITEKNLAKDDEKEEIKHAKNAKIVRTVLAYKYVTLFGLGAIILGTLSCRLSGGKIATLTMALAASEDKIRKGLKNAKEVIGEENLNKIKDKNYEELIKTNFMDSNGISTNALSFGVENGQLFFDGINGYLFIANKEDLLAGLEDAKKRWSRNHCLSTDEYYEDVLGIEPGENYINKWWGPLIPFDYRIRVLNIMGITIETIEFGENDPTESKKTAGIPGGR